LKTPRNAAEAKLARIAWKLKLIQTSAKVTRTPGTTLKSLLLDMVKEEGSTQAAKIERGIVLVNAALGGSPPLVKSRPDSLLNRIC
jgi:hypothetical protein